MLETDGFSAFNEALNGAYQKNIDVSDYRLAHSTHGHFPEKGPQPPFMAMGPSFKKGAVLENGNILNHAPTFAKVLGFNLPEAKGEAIYEILNDSCNS